MSYHINDDCIDCGSCLRLCQHDAIVFNKDKYRYEIDPDRCQECGQCIGYCPMHSIYMDEETKAKVNAEGGQIVRLDIDEEKCIGCTLCAKACPVEAIVGELKQPHVIENWLCARCARCYEKCRKGAIIVTRQVV